MPRRRLPPSLESSAMAIVWEGIKRAFVKLRFEEDEGQLDCSVLFKEAMEDLPCTLVEDVIVRFMREYRKHAGERSRVLNMNGMKISVDAMLKYFMQDKLKTLDLRGILPGDSTKVIKILLVEIHRLTQLTQLYVGRGCNDNVLYRLAESCPKLRVLDVSSSGITDQGIEALCGLPRHNNIRPLPGCKNLVKITMYKCPEVTLEGLLLLLENMSFLRFLGHEQLGDVFDKRGCLSEKSYKLAYFEHTMGYYFDNFLGTRRKMTPFSATKETMEKISRWFPDLTALKIEINDKDETCLQNLLHIQNLQNITLYFSGTLGPAFDTFIQKQGKNLTTLNLWLGYMSYQSFNNIAECCHNIRNLRIILDKFNGTENDVTTIKCFTNLSCFEMFAKCSQTNKRVVGAVIETARCLRKLSLCGEASFMTDEYINQLMDRRHFSALEDLYVTSGLSPEMVQLTVCSARRLIQCCKNLKSLDVSQWQITPEDFYQLQHHVTCSNLDLLLIGPGTENEVEHDDCPEIFSM